LRALRFAVPQGTGRCHMFVHLHCHSHYSFLRAVPSPEEIVAAAVEQKMSAVALTDTNGMYAALPFYIAARKARIKPILGVALDVEWRVASSERREKPKNAIAGASILLLAADAQGYSNLCRLVTLRKLGTVAPSQNVSANETEDDGRPVTLDELAQHCSGLIALVPIDNLSSRAESWRLLPGRSRGVAATNTASPAALCLAHLKSAFSDRLYLEVQHLSPGDGRFLREAEHLGRELAIPLVATNNVHFLKPEEHLHHRAVNAVRIGGLLTTVKPPEITTVEAWFKPFSEMQRLFPDHPELLQNTLEIADRCNLKLELNKLLFPEFPVPDGESPFSYLWKLCFEGARRLYRPLHPEVLSRLTHELGVIEKLHLAPYFLLVWDIVEEARRHGIPAVARGSAASSMVTYCLGISRVCPLRWGLYFERFLNVQRGDCPDIDIDICGARRDELLDYVYAKWGGQQCTEPRQEAHAAWPHEGAHITKPREGACVAGPREGAKVAMIGSFITMHARLAIREIAKVFGVPPAEVNRFTKRLPHRPVREILQAIQKLPECRDLPVNDDPWKTILQVALRLDDAPRHLGIHPCGTVISARPLTELVPLERATKGIIVTQYDMNAIEALGLIKMDLLGQRGFTTMSLALDNIDAANRPSVEAGLQPGSSPSVIPTLPAQAGEGPVLCIGPERRDRSSISTIPANASAIAPDGVTPCPTARQINFDVIPENDPATCDVIASGRTLGVFQIESPAMRGMLRMMKARTLEQIAIALAIIRPGAAEYGSKELFVKRLRGQEDIQYAHPALKEILGCTLGVCIYQEQVMQIAQAVGSMSLAEADLVRRSSAKFSGQRERDRLRAKFLKAAEQIGLAGAECEETWLMVEKFAGFGFCKAHAATYADISYRMAYLKTHHTAEFLAAMCSSGAGFYHVSAYVEEAKRWGIPVLLPSVNHSLMQYTAEPSLGCGSSLARRSFSEDGSLGEGGPLACPERSRGATSLRVGLMQIRGLRLETITNIVREREARGLYRSLEDFLRRVPVERDEIEALIKCGAFGGVCNSTRPALLWQWSLLHEKFRRNLAAEPAGNLFGFALQESPAQTLQNFGASEYTLEQKLRYEREILELCVSGHPLDFLPRQVDRFAVTHSNNVAWSDQLPALLGKRVTLCGWVVTYRHVGTKNYRNMMFVTLEDQRGIFEAVLFPEAYERYGGLVFETRALRVSGRVENDAQINCDRMEAMAKTPPAAETSKSQFHC
jgi:DNA polymerase III subunit alpha